MGETLGKIAIVGEKEQPFGLGVEPADVEQAWQMWREKIEDGIARVGIGSRRNETRRFMQHDVEPALAVDKFAIDFDVVALRGLRAEVGANAAVDSHAPRSNQLITMSTRTESSRGEETVQAHGGEVEALKR